MATSQQLRLSGRQKATHQDKPFRFLDLSPEVRVMVYKNLLRNAQLHIDVPRRLESSLDERNPRSAGASLPGILLASKSLREEALPIFSEQLVAVFHNERGSRQVPDDYLRGTKTVMIKSIDTKFIDDVNMPSLKLILVKQFFHGTPALHGDLGYSIKDYQPDFKVVTDFVRVFKSGRFCSQLRAIHGNGHLPFEVFLVQSVSVEETVGSLHHAKRFASWGCPVVSYPDRVIVFGPPRPTFANMPVQPIARRLQFK